LHPFLLCLLDWLLLLCLLHRLLLLSLLVPAWLTRLRYLLLELTRLRYLLLELTLPELTAERPHLLL
jgi:hypothetical protein